MDSALSKGKKTDDFEERVRSLSSSLPAPRPMLTEEEKDALVARIGPRAARDVVRAKKDVPAARIPFVFSSLDTQDVVDLLTHDCEAAINRALPKRQKN